MLAASGRTIPEGSDWILEPKFDGWRMLAHVTAGGPRLWSRNGRGYHRRLPPLNAALSALPIGTVLDGELVCLEAIEGGRVRCRFDRLGALMAEGEPRRRRQPSPVMFVAFDALAVAGRDLRHLPWRERRHELEGLLAGAHGLLRITPVLDADMGLHHALVADGWEGTVAKRVSGRYRCGRRSRDWLKLKSPQSIARDRARVEASLRHAA